MFQTGGSEHVEQCHKREREDDGGPGAATSQRKDHVGIYRKVSKDAKRSGLKFAARLGGFEALTRRSLDFLTIQFEA
jgi:hypothetical protein